MLSGLSVLFVWARRACSALNSQKRRFPARAVKRERGIARRVGHGHPLVVRALGTAQDAETIYMAFEPCLGGDLVSVLKKKRFLKAAEAQFYGSEIIIALEHVHGQVRRPSCCFRRSKATGTTRYL